MKRIGYANLSKICAALTVALALIGAMGWIVDAPLLKQVRPAYIPIAPSTAVAFMILGCCVFLRVFLPSRPRVRLLNGAGAILVLLPSLWISAESTGYVASQIEGDLFGDFGTQAGVPLGRMSFVTAALLVISGLSLLLSLDHRRGKLRLASEILACVVAISGCTLLVAYAYGTPLLYGVGEAPPALITALCFLLISIAQLSQGGPDSWPIRDFTGDSTRAYLLRTLPAFAVCIVLLEHWIDSLGLSRYLDLNPAVSSALWAAIFAIATGVAVVFLARRLGNALDNTQEALRDSLQVSRTLLDATTDLALLARPDGTLLAINEAAAQWLGGTIDEMLGKSAFDHMPAELAASRRAQGEEVVRTGTPAQFVDEIQGRIFDTRVYPVFDAHGDVTYLAIFTHDITASRQSEEALRTSETLFRSLTEHSYDVITMVDADGTILYDSPAITRMLGYSTEERIGTSVFDYASPAVREAMRGGFVNVAARSGRSMHYEGEFFHKDGSLRVMEGVRTNLLHEPAVRAIVVNYRDVTDRKRMEEELRRSRNLESLGLLAGGIAHDFNNVLTGVIGNLSLLEHLLERDGEPWEIAADALKSAERTKDLTSQLMTFAKGGAPVKETSSIQEVIREVVGLMLSGSTTKPEFRFAHPLHAVDIDRAQIAQVIQNLVLNADHAMPEGGVISIVAENIEVNDAGPVPLAPGPYVKVSVTDQGSGIPQSALPKVFDPYFTTKSSGHGLGLSIAFSIIRRHDGHITATSEPGNGSTFAFYLPASLADVEPLPQDNQEFAHGSVRVLLMDDQETIHKTLRRMLGSLGYDVTSVYDGAEAVEAYDKADSSGAPFDLAIMDLTVPGGMGGREAIERLLDKHPDAKVIVSSGYANDPVMAEFNTYGFAGAISKPVSMADLAATLKDVIGNARPGQPIIA